MTNENAILQKLAEKYGLPQLQKKSSTGYKPIFFFYGGKGVGKTTAALLTPGTIDCISYDGMSMDIKLQMVKLDPANEERIRVFDIGIIELLQEDEITNADAILDHGVRGYDYTKAIVSESTADWIVFDGVDYLINYAEMKMRKENNILPYEGFKNLNLWKHRNQLLRSILTLASQKAGCGVILVGWEQIDQYDEEGKTKSVKAPKWTDILKTASSIVTHISQYNVPSQQLHMHYGFIDSSKNEDLFLTAERIDISNRKPLITLEKYNYLLQKNGRSPTSSIVVETNEIPKEDISIPEVKEEPKKEVVNTSSPAPKVKEPEPVENPVDNDGWGI